MDTISYVVGDCAVLLYDTKVGEIWGHNYDLINHEVWYKAAFNCQMMIESGHDPLQVVCDHAHERGFNFLAHLLLNMAYTPPSRVTNGRVATYNTLHPEWIVGEEPDYPEAVHDNPNRMSYAVPEIRENRLAIVRELVTDYPTDGIDLNFNTYMPLIARREVEEHTETITEWMRDVRRAADAAAEAQGRSKRVVVRMAATVEGNKKMGQDIEAWVGEGLIDTIVAMPVGGDFSSETSRLRELVEVAEGNGVPVIAGMDAVGTDQTRLTHRAATVNAYDAGVRGVMYHRYYPPPHQVSLQHRGHRPHEAGGLPRSPGPQGQDVLRRARLRPPRRHLVRPHGPAPARAYGRRARPGHHDIDVSDDIAAKDEAGELWRCELRIMLHELVHHDEYRVCWNGEEVPESKIRKADWVFQMRPSAGVRGYRLHIDLRNVSLPIKGTNTVRVDLITKDEQLVDSVSIHDIDIVVEYLPHRNALRDEESYAGASIPFTP